MADAAVEPRKARLDQISAVTGTFRYRHAFEQDHIGIAQKLPPRSDAQIIPAFDQGTQQAHICPFRQQLRLYLFYQ